MSADRNSEATAIASLALAFHRAPARHAELMRGAAPLPPSVGILMRLAGGTSPRELSPDLESMAPAEELRKAALFFIEQVLFQRDAGHYRLLGLDQKASPEQIKEHHRLLMRLFHPDRESHADERTQQFATRANLAYNILRDADSRASYDEALKTAPAASVHRPRPVTVMARRHMPQPESFWYVRVYPLLMRYLPQWVLAGTALVSLTLVAVVYQANQPLDLKQPGVAPNVADVGTEQSAADVALPEEVVDDFERKITDAGQMSADAAHADAAKALAQIPVEEPVKSSSGETPASTPRASVATAPKLTVASTSKASIAPSKQPPALRGRDQPAPAKTVEVEVARPATARPVAAKTGQVAPKPAKVAAAIPAVVVAPEPATHAVKPTAYTLPASEAARPAVVDDAVVATLPTVDSRPTQPPLPDPDVLLKRFLEAYERGDTQTCMALLDEAARTDAGGKSDLRRDYDTLFRSTDLRHIKVTRMNWSRDGEFIRGEGQFRSTFMRKGETLLRTHDGQVRVEMVRRGGSALINELYYFANSRS